MKEGAKQYKKIFERTEITVKYQLQMIKEASNFKKHDRKGFLCNFLSLPNDSLNISETEPACEIPNN